RRRPHPNITSSMPSTNAASRPVTGNGGSTWYRRRCFTPASRASCYPLVVGRSLEHSRRNALGRLERELHFERPRLVGPYFLRCLDRHPRRVERPTGGDHIAHCRATCCRQAIERVVSERVSTSGSLRHPVPLLELVDPWLRSLGRRSRELVLELVQLHVGDPFLQQPFQHFAPRRLVAARDFGLDARRALCL